MTGYRWEFATLIGGALTALFLSAALAWGHESISNMKYDGWCCNGSSETGDCQAINPDLVKPVKGGWQVTLRPGDHRLVTEPHTYFMPQKKTRKSEDGEYHACLFPTEATLRCLYLPPMGF